MGLTTAVLPAPDLVLPDAGVQFDGSPLVPQDNTKSADFATFSRTRSSYVTGRGATRRSLPLVLWAICSATALVLFLVHNCFTSRRRVARHMSGSARRILSHRKGPSKKREAPADCTPEAFISSTVAKPGVQKRTRALEQNTSTVQNPPRFQSVDASKLLPKETQYKVTGRGGTSSGADGVASADGEANSASGAPVSEEEGTHSSSDHQDDSVQCADEAACGGSSPLAARSIDHSRDKRDKYGNESAAEDSGSSYYTAESSQSSIYFTFPSASGSETGSGAAAITVTTSFSESLPTVSRVSTSDCGTQNCAGEGGSIQQPPHPTAPQIIEALKSSAELVGFGPNDPLTSSVVRSLPKSILNIEKERRVHEVREMVQQALVSMWSFLAANPESINELDDDVFT